MKKDEQKACQSNEQKKKREILLKNNKVGLKES